jgi:hypothetical protein
VKTRTATIDITIANSVTTPRLSGRRHEPGDAGRRGVQVGTARDRCGGQHAQLQRSDR